MEVLNYQHEHKRYIELDYNYKFLGEVFRVDDLLDFTNEEISPPAAAAVKEEPKNEELPAKLAEPPSLAEEVGSKDDLELIGMHCDDIPELEWLSNFVDDNSAIDETAAEAAARFAAASGCSTVYPFKNSSRGEFKEFKELKELKVECIQEEASDDPASGLESSSNNSEKDRYTGLGSSVPGRARTRTKRSRTKCTEVSSTTSEGSLPEVQQCCSSSFSAESEEYPEYIPRPTKKACSVKGGNRQKSIEKEGYIQKCLHCGSQKTPQWRTGPLGPKTLCNACGVRFKSGRLFPEYRPAASPSFVPQKHSNSHKKVLEMRKMKEGEYSAKLTVSSTTSVTDDEEEEEY